MKKVIWLICCACFYSGQAFAACNATITTATPTEDFVDHGNGAVTHTKTGLMWKKCSEGLAGADCATSTAGTYSWQAALNQAEIVNLVGFAGFSDWRVPNHKELNSIVERQCSDPAVNAAIFPATVSSFYWSSSLHALGASEAWYLSFSNGADNVDIKSAAYFVRLVRGEQ